MRAPPRREFATVVSGVPRSGTSLLMQMLRAGGMELLTDGVRAPDADNPLGYLEYEPVKATLRDASWVAAAVGRAVKVIHALVPHLPPGLEYRVLLAERDLAEVLASQRAMLERRGAAGAGSAGAAADRALARSFRAQLAALRRWARSRAEVSLLALDYADVLADPPGAARELDAFLGGGLDRAAMAAAVVPGLRRQRAGGARAPRAAELRSARRCRR